MTTTDLQPTTPAEKVKFKTSESYKKVGNGISEKSNYINTDMALPDIINRHDGFSPSAKALFAIIHNLCQNPETQYKCIAGNTFLAKQIALALYKPSCSKRTVRRALQALNGANIITIVHGYTHRQICIDWDVVKCLTAKDLQERIEQHNIDFALCVDSLKIQQAEQDRLIREFKALDNERTRVDTTFLKNVRPQTSHEAGEDRKQPQKDECHNVGQDKKQMSTDVRPVSTITDITDLTEKEHHQQQQQVVVDDEFFLFFEDLSKTSLLDTSVRII